MHTKRPYELPKPITADPSILEHITPQLIEGYINKHESKFKRYDYLENLYKGFHDVFRQPEKENWKPDNRLAVNFPRYITDTFLGYAYGVPIKCTAPEDSEDERLKEFYRNNEMNDHDAEMAKMCCIYGHAWEFYYQDEETNTKVVAYNPKDLFCIFDDTVQRRALMMILYGRHTVDGVNNGVLYGLAATADTLYYFDNGKFVDRKENPYSLIPCDEWRLNEERIGLFEGVAGLVETYNRTLGEKANDVDSFAEAYLAVIGSELDDEDVYRIRDNRIINLYGTDNAKDILVQFLTKPTADGTQENLLNRLENLIYQISMVANISDEQFGNASSGVALAYKLQAMSNLAVTFDRKIEKSLRKRFKIWSSLSTNVADREVWRDIDIKFTRNLPKNLQEEAQTASQLEGIVSKETQLSVLSIVPDVKKEIEKMEEEEEEQMQQLSMYQQTMGAVNGENNAGNISGENEGEPGLLEK